MGAIAAAYPILTAIAGGAATAVVSRALTPKPQQITAPTVTPPTPMPTPGDDAAQAQKRQSLTDQMARQGRASTILTDQTGTSDKLGG